HGNEGLGKNIGKWRQARTTTSGHNHDGQTETRAGPGFNFLMKKIIPEEQAHDFASTGQDRNAGDVPRKHLRPNPLGIEAYADGVGTAVAGAINFTLQVAIREDPAPDIAIGERARYPKALVHHKENLLLG